MSGSLSSCLPLKADISTYILHLVLSPLYHLYPSSFSYIFYLCFSLYFQPVNIKLFRSTCKRTPPQ